MKKIAIIFLVSIFIFSCTKKDWTCTCLNDSDGSIFEVSNYTLTEEDAISACQNRDDEEDISCTLERD